MYLVTIVNWDGGENLLGAGFHLLISHIQIFTAIGYILSFLQHFSSPCVRLGVLLFGQYIYWEFAVTLTQKWSVLQFK